jgi:carbon monoxide dehydrogenase subunit G
MVQMTEKAQTSHQEIIAAPIEKVYGIIADLDTLVTLFPGGEPTGRSGDWATGDYVVSLPGINTPITFSGIKVRIADSQAPTSVTVVSDGPLKGTWTWNLQSQDDGTRATLEGSYQMDTSFISNALGGAAGGIGGGAADQVISPLLGANDSNMQGMLANLKKRASQS